MFRTGLKNYCPKKILSLIHYRILLLTNIIMENMIP